ncbi:hypothetical protein GCM10020258_51250 [Sphingomonas yabuuchiae]
MGARDLVDAPFDQAEPEIVVMVAVDLLIPLNGAEEKIAQAQLDRAQALDPACRTIVVNGLRIFDPGEPATVNLPARFQVRLYLGALQPRERFIETVVIALAGVARTGCPEKSWAVNTISCVTSSPRRMRSQMSEAP